MLDAVGIAISPAERAAIEVADLGLGDPDHYGLQIVIYENNDRYCAKELILFPRQICPEHRHPHYVCPGDTVEKPGKQETFRCRWGHVYLYVAGEPTPSPQAIIPEGDEACFTACHEIVLEPGDQYTLSPETLHWFQAGDEGAIISEFSTTNTDEYDVFTDPRIKRLPVYE
ncbi:MAG: D-lyxose/D-mannose family sugar isomerase [Candidatus Aminicenantes bacterium]|nr:D-lyxose/D-mannose family sugar isomerase [Candidatus Aminicenantes bacterium]